MPEGVKLAKDAVARGAWPVVLADHSDRSGSATWILQQVIEQDLSDVLIATIADRKAIEAVKAKGLKAGDPFDMEVGGLADESAGTPVRVLGRSPARRGLGRDLGQRCLRQRQRAAC